MAKIEKLKKGAATIYPATIPQAVIDPTSGKSARAELDEKANHGYESNPKTLKEVDDEVIQLAGESNAIYSGYPVTKPGYTRLDGTFSPNVNWKTTLKINLDIFVDDFIEVIDVNSYDESGIIIPSVLGFDINGSVVYTSMNKGSFVISKDSLNLVSFLILNSSSLQNPTIKNYGNLSKNINNHEKRINEHITYTENQFYGGDLYSFDGYFNSQTSAYFKNTAFKSTLPIRIEDILRVTPTGIQLLGNVSGYEDFIASVTFVDENKITVGTYGPGGYNIFIPASSIPENAYYVIFNGHHTYKIKVEGYGNSVEKIMDLNSSITSISSTTDNLMADLFNGTLEYIVGFYRQDGTLNTSSSWKTTYKIVIDIIKDLNGNINVNGLTSLGETVASVCYFDKDGDIVERVFLNGRNQIKAADIPENSYFITFTTSNTGSITLENHLNKINKNNALLESIIEAKGIKLIDEDIVSGSTVNKFYFHAISKGDIVQTEFITEDGSQPSAFASFHLRNDPAASDGMSQSATPFYNEYKRTVLADNDYKGIFFYVPGIDVNVKVIVTIYSNGHKLEESTVYVAASDSTESDKRLANYVCDGVNDEVEIQRAIDSLGYVGTVILLAGRYYIDEIKQTRYGSIHWAAIAVKKRAGALWNSKMEITIRGKGHRSSNMAYNSATTIIVNEQAFANVPEDIQPSIIGCERDIARFSGAYYSDFRIEFPNSNHKCIGINLEYFGHGIIERIAMTCNNQSEMPVEGLVGLRCFHGYSTGHTSELNNIACGSGFYTAFQMGGEHVIARELHSRYNYSGYTFGEYDGGQYGTFDHAITMINCCDEKSGRLPLFVDCGGRTEDISSVYPNIEARQCIHMIDFVLEINPISIWDGLPIKRMREVNPGQFCGYINFTNGGGGRNQRNTQLWENDGSGVNFKTENSTHAKGGTTAERNTYYAQYMQHYYDTDLNKELICIDPATQKWVDSMGNEVS